MLWFGEITGIFEWVKESGLCWRINRVSLNTYRQISKLLNYFVWFRISQAILFSFLMKCTHEHTYHMFFLMVSDFCCTRAMLKKLARWYKNMQISDKKHTGKRNMKKLPFLVQRHFLWNYVMHQINSTTLLLN